MKTNWQTKKLGEVIVEHKKSSLKSKGNKEGVYPFFVSGSNVKTADKYLIDGMNIFLPTGGNFFVHYLNGKAAYSTDTWAVKTNKEIDIKYFYYFLILSQEFIGKKLFKGATIKHLQKKDFKDIEIPLPSIPEQHRIVKTLDEAFEKTAKAEENTKKNLQNSKDVFRSYLQSVFTDDRGKLETIELGEIIILLTDYHANGSYRVLKSNVELKKSEDYAWMVRSTDFESNFKNEKRYITKKSYDFLKKSKIFGNEIIICKIGNAGKVYLMPKIDRPCSLAMNSFLIRMDYKKCSSEYIYQYLNSQSGREQIESRILGTTTKTITKDNVRSIKIPLPPIKEQHSIVAKLDALSAETKKLEANYQKKLADLEELKKSILKKAFNGEL